MRLVLASNNAKKLSELQALLNGMAVSLVTQGSLGVTEAEEPHHTFIENALAKARHAAQATGSPAVADDSGLCVQALGGEPGVISAHYAGLVAPQHDREATRRLQDAANNRHLLERLQGVADRRAHFVCTLVALRSAEDPQTLVAVGRWPGQILSESRGTRGFGYDPLMFIPEFGCTVAELSAADKNRVSHRARAMHQLRQLMTDSGFLA
jgi:XTP/dITP diphosphohydrolase